MMQEYVNSQEYVNDNFESSCCICGHAEASWHYGAVVCEACRKFYVRCKKDKRNGHYKCVNGSNDCEITVKTRANCQYCRKRKCDDFMDMQRISTSTSDSTISTHAHLSPANLTFQNMMKDLNCKICHSTASGIHFGVITCEACKAFFRRSLKTNQSYECMSNRSCQITSSDRSCRYCRLVKCKEMGMFEGKSKVGRKAGVEKQQIFLHSRSHKRSSQDIQENQEAKRVRIDQDEYQDEYSPNTSDYSPTYSTQEYYPYYPWQQYQQNQFFYNSASHPQFYSYNFNFHQANWSNWAS